MATSKPKFSFPIIMYFGVMASSIILLPIEVEAIRAKTETVTSQSWLIAVFIVLVTITLLWHANLRCTGEKLSYIQGLLFVTSFMRGAGVMYMSMILILISLSVLMPASVVISIYGELTGKNNLTPMRYHKLVLLFHKQLVRQ